MITPSFSLTATERVLPSMALDFTTASLDSRVTFTRSGGTATVVDNSGYVAAVTANTPRFDYDPITLVCKGLLIEEARTNLFSASSDFSTAWTKTNCSISVDQIYAPDNTQTADKFISTGINAFLALNGLVTTGVAYALSVYAKKGEIDWLRLSNQTAAANTAWFDLTNGAVGTINGAGNTANITDMGNGWFRCVLNIASGVNASVFIAGTTGNGVTTAYTGDGTSGIYIWGAQLEAGAFPTSYIPTVASQVTRTADVATMTGTDFSDWYNQTEGTFVMECVAPATGGAVWIAHVDDGASTKRMRMLYQTGAQVIVVNSGTQATLDAGTFTPNVSGRMSFAYKDDSFRSGIDGGLSPLDSSGTVPTGLDRIYFGSNSGGANFLNGTLSHFDYYKQRVIDAEVQSISK